MNNNFRDLEKILQSYIEKALKLTGETIYEKLKEKVEAYYNEPVFSEPNKKEPDIYQRTNTLKNSLFKPVVTKNNGSFILTTGFKDDYLSFEYPGSPRFGKNNKPATGEDVLEFFNSGFHGGTVKGSHDFWDEALEELGNEQGILNIFKENCKKVGLPIK